MQTIIDRQHSLIQNRRGLSNIIVVVLSFVILLVIVSNVILWSYQMNQLDWERTEEAPNVSSVARMTRSSWFVAQGEYRVNKGGRTSGSFIDTQAVDSRYESFRESPPTRELDINGTFSIDLATFPLAYIQSVEIQLRYRVDDTGEKWFLKAYNWTSRTYSDGGFNSTAGHTPVSGWNTYAVDLTNKWRSYMWNDGKVLVKVHDQGPDSTRTNVDIDFLSVRAVINGTAFTIQNKGANTAHFVSIWVNNSTVHKRYEADLFVNSGETFSYQRVDIPLPNGQYTVKVVTERGNTAVYAAG